MLGSKMEAEKTNEMVSRESINEKVEREMIVDFDKSFGESRLHKRVDVANHQTFLNLQDLTVTVCPLLIFL
jgi:ribosomal protein S6